MSPRAVAAIAERVECLQAADGGVEHALAALAVDIVLEVAGHRGDDLDLLGGEKLRQVLLARLLQDGQVAAVDHLHADVARGRAPAAGNAD